MAKVTVMQQRSAAAPAEASIASEMQQFFQTYGSFPAADVQRVLGDPGKGVTLKPGEELAFSKQGK